MFEKSFITDCEGPLTLNDNAFELADYFIEDGGELFKILSLYDDYLADIVKKENYKAGNTLKLILPFFLVENLKNSDLVDFSQNHIYSVSDSKFLIEYLKKACKTMSSIRESLGSQGKLNPATLIFWQKNFDGLSDVQQVEIAAVQQAVKSPEQIAAEIDDDIPET